MEGTKFDDHKVQVARGVLHYFPRAIEYVARVSQFGSKKYAWDNWRHLDEGLQRYTDADARHFIQESYEENDIDSGLLHAGHHAWNALARLELLLTPENNNDG